MNTRLKQFLSAENISQSLFADTINVARASVSHALSGRSKPGYDFIAAIMEAYPSLNMEWLIIGKGKMYKENCPAPPPQAEVAMPALLFEDESEDREQEEDIPVTGQHDVQPERNVSSRVSNILSETLYNSVQTVVKQRKATKVVVFFDDGTFQEL